MHNIKYILIGLLALVFAAALAGVSAIQQINKTFSNIEFENLSNSDDSVSGDDTTDTSLEDYVEEMGADGEVIADTDVDTEMSESMEESEGVNALGGEETILITTRKRTSKTKFSSYDREEPFAFLHGKQYDSDTEIRNGITSRAPDISLDECLNSLSKASAEGKIMDRQSIEEVFNALLYWLRYESTDCLVSLNGNQLTFDSQINKNFTKYIHVRQLDVIPYTDRTGIEQINIYLYDIDVDDNGKPLEEFKDIVENRNEITEMSATADSTESEEE